MNFENNFVKIEQREDKTQNILKVIVRFSGTPTDEEMIDYLRFVGDIYKLNHPFIIIYDASEIGMLTLAQVYKQADFMRARDADTRRLIKCCAIILTSQIAKTMLNTVFTLKPPACKLDVFKTMEEAKIWIKKIK